MVTLKIEKKHLYALSLTLGIVIGVLVVNAVTPAFSSTRPWHPLQQVSTTADGSASVDSNHDGVIDNAERLGGLSPGAYQKDVFRSCSGSSYITEIKDDGDVVCRAEIGPITGTYTGTGSGTRSIAVPGTSASRRIKVLTLMGTGSSSYLYKTDTMSGNCFYSPGNVFNPSIVQCGDFTNTGFTVSGPANVNVLYHYTAWLE